MAAIKSYTDIEQSRMLTKILAVETSDYYYPVTYIEESTNKYLLSYIKPYIGRLSAVENSVDTTLYIPCWSFSALLDILPDGTDIMKDKSDTENEKYMCSVGVKGEVLYTFGSNPVDVCVTMIGLLHELSLL